MLTLGFHPAICAMTGKDEQLQLCEHAWEAGTYLSCFGSGRKVFWYLACRVARLRIGTVIMSLTGQTAYVTMRPVTLLDCSAAKQYPAAHSKDILLLRNQPLAQCLKITTVPILGCAALLVC